MPTSPRATPASPMPDRLRPYTFHGVDLALRGPQAVGDCPFCGREQKFTVEVATGLWRCMVCASGTAAGGGNGLVFTRLLYECSGSEHPASSGPLYSSVQPYTPSQPGVNPRTLVNGRIPSIGIGKGVNSEPLYTPPGTASAGPTPRRAAAGGTGGGTAAAAPRADVGVPGGFLAGVAADRRLLYPATVAAWGVRRAADGAWLVPGYGTDGKLDQVYRREQIRDRGQLVWVLKPTPDIWPAGKAHALHLPAADFDPARPDLVVCEGPWDGMALWEVWDRAAKDTNIVAVPGCGTWRDEWTEMCRGKRVTLMFDSDHPRETMPGSGRYARAGYDGMVRVAKRLSGSAASVRWLKWGPDGHDPSKPSGYDVRDFLSGL